MSTNVIAVLGVGPALGGAVARRFGREGLAVALMARRPETLEPVERTITEQGGRALSIATDATKADSVAAAFERVSAELGPVDVFVYNAGAFQMGGILDISPETFERCWQVNCLGGFLGAQRVLPGMVERGRGTIILTGATAALRGSAKFSCLAVGKFGLRALAQSMAREFGPQGVHVAHVIVDGQIDGPKMPAERDKASMLDPEAIAEVYWQLHNQPSTTWTLELDLRPAIEKF